MTIDEILVQALKEATETNAELQKNKTINDDEDSVKMMESIKNHAVKDRFPESLFHHRSPNQTDKEAEYIKNNYKNVTLPVFLDYINTICRPFGDGNWSIEYAEEKQTYVDAGLTFKQYVESEIPTYKSLENFIKYVLPTTKTIDANGYLAVRPKEIDYIEDELGEMVIDSQQLYKPTMFYFDSRNVIEVEEDEYCLFLSYEKSAVEYNGRVVNEGSIFELYTKNDVYLITQTGKKIDNTFKIELYFSHNTGKIPCIQLKGIPTIEDDEILWQSPFLYASDLLDLVLMNSNYLQLSMNSCVFPVKVMYGSPCEFKDTEGHFCEDGKILNHMGQMINCPSCNGVGLKSRISPIGTLLLNPKTRTSEGDAPLNQSPLSYVSPDVTTLEFIHSKIDKDEMKAREILHLRTRNNFVTAHKDITATEVYDDAKSMTAFVKPISDQIFEIYEFLLYHIGVQRYGADFVAPELTYPKSFDFKTPQDYLDDINKAMTANLPPSFIQTLLMQYINSFYADNVTTTKVFILISNADRLFGLSSTDINLMMAKGTIAKWEQILHTSILMFIDDFIRQDATFIDKEINVQIDMLNAKAKEVENTISPIQNIAQLLLPPTQ